MIFLAFSQVSAGHSLNWLALRVIECIRCAFGLLDKRSRCSWSRAGRSKLEHHASARLQHQEQPMLLQHLALHYTWWCPSCWWSIAVAMRARVHACRHTSCQSSTAAAAAEGAGALAKSTQHMLALPCKSRNHSQPKEQTTMMGQMGMQIWQLIGPFNNSVVQVSHLSKPFKDLSCPKGRQLQVRIFSMVAVNSDLWLHHSCCQDKACSARACKQTDAERAHNSFPELKSGSLVIPCRDSSRAEWGCGGSESQRLSSSQSFPCCYRSIHLKEQRTAISRNECPRTQYLT